MKEFHKMPRATKSISAAERARDYHAGPGDKEPIDPEGNRLKAAWDLAGRVKGGDPDEIRRKIIRFAREHNLMDKLPQSALDWHRGQSGSLAQKATTENLREVTHYAYHLIPEYEQEAKRRFIEAIQQRGTAYLLPDEAHGFMHEHNMPHQHDGETHELHVHTISKAFNPVAKEFASVKSYKKEGEPLIIEGWLSTPDKDLEKDIVQPESFKPSMKSYFRRYAPLSYEHHTDRIPAGHLQRGAIVRDGKIITEATHRTDPAQFEHLQESMEETGTRTGVYVRGIITNETVGKSVDQGDMGSFSYIANVTKYKLLPDGGREFLEQDPWIESTVAAYPVNKNAVITVAKAFGLEEQTDMGWEDQLEDLLRGAAAPEHQPTNSPAPVTKGVTADEMKGLFTQMKTELTAEISAQFEAKVETEVEARVEKALSTMRGQSAGRQAPPSDEPSMDDEPVKYIVSKAKRAKSDNDLTWEDKSLMVALTKHALLQGMKDSEA